MTISFAIIAALIIVSGIAAMTMRNLVHCALALTLTFVGLAAAYLQLEAQFVGFVQILVYVGAVANLIVFAILLTRGSETSERSIFSSTWIVGALIAVVVFGILAVLIGRSSVMSHKGAEVPVATVQQIGDKLMRQYVLPLEVVG